MPGGRVRWLLAALLTGFSAAPAAGQTVVGHVFDRGTREPLGGAFVVLTDTAGARQAAGLAGEDGRFVIRAEVAGRYRLTARLIGYADTETAPFDVGRGETVQRDIEVSVRAVSLDGIRAEVGERCRRRPGTGTATARLWEEARKALEITDWAQREGKLRYQVVEHRRELDAETLRVLKAEKRGRSGYYGGSPYRSLDAERLDRHGYVQEDGAGGWLHYGPDADVLLSDQFLASHCFRVVDAPRDEPGLVGLGFEPVPDRDLPDIEGVLWLDRGTAEPRRLEFRYSELPYVRGTWAQLGGRVELERLATGIWIVRRWHIRMPLEMQRVSGFRRDAAGREVVLKTLSEAGAEVTRVRTRDGRVLAEARGATLYGSVADTATGQPLADATIAVLATGLRATTGPDGAYRITGLPQGRFAVEVAHPDLARLGAPPTRASVNLVEGQAARLPVHASVEEAARRLCARQGDHRDLVAFHGEVWAPGAEAPTPGARVRALTPAGEARVRADSVGGYALCVERSDTVRLAAVEPAEVLRGSEALTRWTAARPGDRRVVRLDLQLDPGAVTGDRPAAAERGRVWINGLLGTVRTESGQPIAGAMVTLVDADGEPADATVTNRRGEFTFLHPDAKIHRYTLVVEHVDHAVARQPVEFRPAEQVVVEVTLGGR